MSRAEDRTNGRQAVDMSLLNQLVFEVYLAAWTRAAIEDEQFRRPSAASDDVTGDDPGEIHLDLDRFISMRLSHVDRSRYLGFDQLCFEAELVIGVGITGRFGFGIDRQQRASTLRHALTLACLAASVEDERLRRLGAAALVKADALTTTMFASTLVAQRSWAVSHDEQLRADLGEHRLRHRATRKRADHQHLVDLDTNCSHHATCSGSSRDHSRRLDRQRQSERKQHRPSLGTEHPDCTRLSGSAGREHVGSVCYTRGPSLAGHTNYRKGG